ncbi:MAG: AzlD domain-containing protein [Anaerovoracaceae bacterium]
MDNLSILSMLIVAGIITFLIRWFPFAVFKLGSDMGSGIRTLGKKLPFSAIAILVIYCLRNINPLVFPYGLPEAISILAVILLHLWKRNNLISIGSGTVIYMILIQQFFP